jgi:hypothetical protein
LARRCRRRRASAAYGQVFRQPDQSSQPAAAALPYRKEPGENIFHIFSAVPLRRRIGRSGECFLERAGGARPSPGPRWSRGWGVNSSPPSAVHLDAQVPTPASATTSFFGPSHSAACCVGENGAGRLDCCRHVDPSVDCTSGRRFPGNVKLSFAVSLQGLPAGNVGPWRRLDGKARLLNSTGGVKPATVLSELTRSAYRASPGRGPRSGKFASRAGKKGG